MKTAVFYDLENIGLASKNGEFEETLTSLLKLIKASTLVGNIVMQKAYARKTYHALAQVEPVLKKHKIELVLAESLSKAVNKKANMVDFKMGVDVIASIATKRSINTIAVASGDNDFGFLCQQIKEMGRKLLVISRFNTTGDIMMNLCDDWIDLNGQELTPKFIRNSIEARLPKEFLSGDFFSSFGEFLKALENDSLILRYLSSFGLPLSLLVPVMQSRNIVLPRHKDLGFANVTAFFDVLLCETNFERRDNNIVYVGKSKNPLSQRHLIENTARLPMGYTHEKLHKYYELCAELDDIDEMQNYISFMRRNGVLRGTTLCPWHNIRTVISKHLQNTMETAGIAVDQAEMAKFSKLL